MGAWTNRIALLGSHSGSGTGCRSSVIVVSVAAATGNEHGPSLHRDAVHCFVERGRHEGAEIVAGGEFGDGRGAFHKPTALAKVSSPRP
jgi:acyl-CoA reductase-like NAD-dependent aldehyde dehydrogenase